MPWATIYLIWTHRACGTLNGSEDVCLSIHQIIYLYHLCLYYIIFQIVKLYPFGIHVSIYVSTRIHTSIYLIHLSTNLIQSIYLSTYLLTYLSFYLPTYLSFYLPTYLSFYLSTYIPIYLSVYLSIYLSYPILSYPILSNLSNLSYLSI